MAKPPAQVQLKGLRELDRALGKADKELRRDLRGRLKDVAETVASEARSTASRKGLRRSGDMIRGIRAFALSGRAGVRSGAVHGGFNYPRRLEFEDRGGEPYGPRASVYPAVEASEDDLRRDMERLLDDVTDDFYGRRL